jgi:hypothetical protein
VDNSWIIALFIWGAKEAYHSFAGSRAKTLEALDKAKREIIILQVNLDNAILKIEKIQDGVNRLESKRVYRD